VSGLFGPHDAALTPRGGRFRYQEGAMPGPHGRAPVPRRAVRLRRRRLRSAVRGGHERAALQSPRPPRLSAQARTAAWRATHLLSSRATLPTPSPTGSRTLWSADVGAQCTLPDPLYIIISCDTATPHADGRTVLSQRWQAPHAVDPNKFLGLGSLDAAAAVADDAPQLREGVAATDATATLIDAPLDQHIGTSNALSLASAPAEEPREANGDGSLSLGADDTAGVGDSTETRADEPVEEPSAADDGSSAEESSSSSSREALQKEISKAMLSLGADTAGDSTETRADEPGEEPSAADDGSGADGTNAEAVPSQGADTVGESAEPHTDEPPVEPLAADDSPSAEGTTAEAALTLDGETGEVGEAVEAGGGGGSDDGSKTEDVAAARAMVEPWLERMHLAQADASAKKAAKKAKTWPFAFAGLLALCTLVRSDPCNAPPHHVRDAAVRSVCVTAGDLRFQPRRRGVCADPSPVDPAVPPAAAAHPGACAHRRLMSALVDLFVCGSRFEAFALLAMQNEIARRYRHARNKKQVFSSSSWSLLGV
jgi:hypothetical protein